MIRVPDLRRVAVADVGQALRLADLRGAGGIYFVAPAHWREEIDPLAVSLQAPRAGASVGRGGVVGFWAFARSRPGQAIVSAPDLRGRSWGDARAELERAGLRPSRGPGMDGLAPADIVEDQYPRPGQKVYEQTSVCVRASRLDAWKE